MLSANSKNKYKNAAAINRLFSYTFYPVLTFNEGSPPMINLIKANLVNSKNA